MPIYEFRCSECEHVFEELVPSSASGTGTETAVRCERCESGEVTRLLSGFAVNADTKRSPAPPPGPCGSSCACFPPD